MKVFPGYAVEYQLETFAFTSARELVDYLDRMGKTGWILCHTEGNTRTFYRIVEAEDY